MRLIFILNFFIVIGCQSKTSHKLVQNSIDNNISIEVPIPKNVLGYIKNNLKDMVIPDTSDYSKAWWSFHDKNKNPFFVVTDLNDDNAADYAFILKTTKAIRLVILLSKDTSFTHWVANDFEETYKEKVKNIQFGLAVERPGLTDCVVDNKECSLELKSNGITLMVLDQKGIIYYCSDGKIKSFRTVNRLSDYTVKDVNE